MRIALIEDEPPALEALERAIAAWDPRAEIVGRFGSVRDTVAWLGDAPEVDLLLCDLQLSDGLSLAIFERAQVTCPVIFCTAYEDYLAEAMRTHGIDYLLKPIERGRLEQALDKYLRLRSHFVGRLGDLARAARGRERLLVRDGNAYVSLAVDRVAYFVSEHKLAVAVEQDGRRHLLDLSLTELEQTLDPRSFFRANRTFLIGFGAVRQFTTAPKGRLHVLLEPTTELVISQENARRFRAWLDR